MTTQNIHAKYDPFRGEVADYTLEVFLDGSGVLTTADDNKMVIILNALRAEWRRLDAGGAVTRDGFDKFIVCNLMGQLLMHRVVTIRTAKHEAGERPTDQDRKITRVLSQAALDLRDLMNEYAVEFGDLSVPDNLPERLWFTFFNVTPEECRADAAEIVANIKAAQAARNAQEQIA
jgi:hypothetical protein